MCNLSEGIEERALAKGIITVLRVAEKGNKEDTIQQLCEGMNMEIAEAEKWYDEYKKQCAI